MADTSAELIRRMEGFRPTPYYDNNAWRVGYGSDTVTLPDGTVQQVTQNMAPITRADAQRDLDRRIPQFQQQGIIPYVGQEAWARLPVETQSALTSIAYNYGSLAGLPSIVRAVQSGDPGQIATAVANRAGDNGGQNAARRTEEAAIIAGHPIPPANIPAASVPAWVQSGGAVGRDTLNPPVPASQSPSLQNIRDHPLQQPTPLQDTLPPIGSSSNDSPALAAAKQRLAAARAGTGNAATPPAAVAAPQAQPVNTAPVAPWIAQGRPATAVAPPVATPASDPASSLYSQAWTAKPVGTSTVAQPYNGNQPNYVGREVSLPNGGETSSTAGNVAMPHNVRPSSISYPDTAPWLAQSPSLAANALNSANSNSGSSLKALTTAGAAISTAPKMVPQTIQVLNPNYTELGSAAMGAPDLANITPYLDANGNVVDPTAAKPAAQPKYITKTIMVPAKGSSGSALTPLGGGGQQQQQLRPGDFVSSGGEVYQLQADGSFSKSLGRTAANSSPSLANSIISGVGNALGVNAGLANGEDIAHMISLGAPIAVQPGAARQFNADTGKWEAAAKPILDHAQPAQRVIPQAAIDAAQNRISGMAFTQGMSPGTLTETARGIAGAADPEAAVRLNARAMTEEGYGSTRSDGVQENGRVGSATQWVAQNTNISRHDNPKAYAAALAAAQARIDATGSAAMPKTATPNPAPTAPPVQPPVAAPAPSGHYYGVPGGSPLGPPVRSSVPPPPVATPQQPTPTGHYYGVPGGSPLGPPARSTTQSVPPAVPPPVAAPQMPVSNPAPVQHWGVPAGHPGGPFGPPLAPSQPAPSGSALLPRRRRSLAA